ncbi:hypothetical protein [Schlesneria sp. T3-172]|uniref:hypothetical protein n=1 Tax=Schlesneria sphaerica TaxID=3373610 RepID=UPI0037C68946
MMPIHVLVASSSAYRRWWYVEQLQQHDMEVTTAHDGLTCIQQMRACLPDVVLLEPSLLWGGSHGVLAVRSQEPEFQHIPVVLVAVDGISPDWYELSRYSVQGLLLRRPSAQKLAATLYAALNEECDVASTCSDSPVAL